MHAGAAYVQVAIQTHIKSEETCVNVWIKKADEGR
jgi:hypothetical protein